MARIRDYAAEYARRQARAVQAGYSGYYAQRRTARYGPTGQATPGVRPRSRRRVHDAVGVGVEPLDDWENMAFASSRVSHARYSSSRRELHVMWSNAPGGSPYPGYIYDAVDPATWEAFQSAGSPGRFVNGTLNSYPYRPDHSLAF